VTKTPWNDGYIQANGLAIHFYRTGGDKPPLVLSHGAADDGLCWVTLARELQADYDVIMLDARGHGLSDSGQGEYSLAARAADLAGAIQALGLEKPVIGGHSMGADSSLHLAIHSPELIRGVVLEDPPLVLPGQTIFGGEMGKYVEKYYWMFSGGMRLLKILPSSIGVTLARSLNPTFPDEAVLAWVESKKRLSDDFQRSLFTMDNIERPYDLLAQVEVPALLLIGDREQGAIVDYNAAQIAVQGHPNVQIAHMAGAGHTVRALGFQQYVEALRKFLSEVY